MAINDLGEEQGGVCVCVSVYVFKQLQGRGMAMRECIKQAGDPLTLESNGKLLFVISVR